MGHFDVPIGRVGDLASPLLTVRSLTVAMSEALTRRSGVGRGARTT